MRLRLVTATLAAVLFVAVPMTAAYALTSKDVERELMCQCGCTMVVDVCDCETANQIRVTIAGMIGEGQSKSQIIDYFIGQYGEKMLASPSKKGFNLVAWILPFAAVVAGGAALFFILKTWVLKGRKGENDAVSIVQPVSIDDRGEYRGRLEEELRRFREEGQA